MENKYVPGVCNIGPAEMEARRQTGWIGLFVTLGLGFLLYSYQAPQLVRLILFFPATIGALGFLQSALHFCVGFGMSGLFNFNVELGKTESVSQQEFRHQDRQKAIFIIIYAVIIGAIVAAAATYF